MAIKECSAFPKAPVLLEPQHQIVQWGRFIPLYRETVGVLYNLSWLAKTQSDVTSLDQRSNGNEVGTLSPKIGVFLYSKWNKKYHYMQEIVNWRYITVSLYFKWYVNIRELFYTKIILPVNQDRNYLNHTPKINLIARLEIELANNDITVQYVGNYTTKTPANLPKF